MRRKTWTRPRSIKVFEIDIYQSFVQMRQATPRRMFSLLFLFGTNKLQLTETNESNSWVLPYHINCRLISGTQFPDFCSF